MHHLAVTDLSLTPMLSLGIDFQILWKLIHVNWSVPWPTLIIPQRREPAYSNSNFSPTMCNESSRIYPFRSHSAATSHGEAVWPSFITMATTVHDHSLSKDPQYSGLQAGQICFRTEGAIEKAVLKQPSKLPWLLLLRIFWLSWETWDHKRHHLPVVCWCQS